MIFCDFINYFRTSIDPKADAFLIDPASDNPKAKYVYMKAGFKHACDFMMEGDVSGAGKVHHLLTRKFEPTISILEATMDDYPRIQNMARFYVYDLSRECGAISSDWAIPSDENYLMFTAESSVQEILRFVIGKLMSAPEVYNPSRLTLMIDDFSVTDESEWYSIGFKLVQEIEVIAKKKGAAQILVVCGAHDEPKRRFLKNMGLVVASEWYVGII